MRQVVNAPSRQCTTSSMPAFGQDHACATTYILLPHAIVLRHPERLYGIEVAPARLNADILQVAVT
jgi:hypothetical protein